MIESSGAISVGEHAGFATFPATMMSREVLGGGGGASSAVEHKFFMLASRVFCGRRELCIKVNFVKLDYSAGLK
jgi:hypothetical protein